ncbi:hypothetical protein [Okeania sp.]|uniref:hypothetical protein n=1 Tax=Okeania sp. TaxID=3100323 RepID=UPI002B4B8470|nr:hypothetical protein [Okeania sp.]MEB3340726.1 hypothetical protein [Okeania sp.]
MSLQILMGCGNAFHANLERVREAQISNGKALSNPAKLPEDSPLKVKYREIYPNAFKIKIPEPRLPNQELFQVLKEVKESEPNAKNSVAFLDPFGNLVLCLPDTFDKSPVHTAFMNITQNYAKICFKLMNDLATREQANEYLDHPRNGTFVFLHAPNPNSTRTIMTWGAYGSTIAETVTQIFPANFQYYCPPTKGTLHELRSTIMNLPPFYRKKAQLSVMQVAPEFT